MKKKGGGRQQDAKAEGTRGRKTRKAGNKGGAKGKGKEKKKPNNNHNQGNPSPEGAEQTKSAPRPATGQVRRTRTRLGGRPARPGQEGHAHAQTCGTWALHPLTQKGAVSASTRNSTVHRRGPPSKEGRHGKPEASVTGSTHANHRSTGSPRLTPEGPARDDPIAGAPNGYDAERAQRPCLGGGQRQAQ